MRNFDDFKGRWKHRKTGKIVDVVSMNTRDDSLGLRHESGRQSTQMIHYFKEQYVRVADEKELIERVRKLWRKLNTWHDVKFDFNKITLEFEGHKYEIREVE